MIELDGEYGEGGGALVRTALALSALTGQEFKVNNIRAGREKPGLKAQHLASIKALKEICNAETNEIELGSTELYFKPGKVKRGKFNIDIGTAGSISLLLQAIIPPCLFAPGKVTLNVKGGTCGKWQASVDYLQNVLLPQLKRFVEKIELRVLKRGYFPKGGGEIILEINPRISLLDEIPFKATKFDLTNKEELQIIKGIVNLSMELEDKKIGERIMQSAKNQLKGNPVDVRVEYANTNCVGGEILLWANFKHEIDNPIILGSNALLDKRKTSEEVGKEASIKLMEEMKSDYCVDEHMADQLIVFMGLLPGSVISANLSKHAETNIYVTEQFLPVGFKVEGNLIAAKDL